MLLCVLAVGGLASAFACGLDESGLAGPDASVDTNTDTNTPPFEAGNPDVALPPPSCPTTELSCLGFDAGVPDGWSAYVVEPDGGACPSAAFVETTWQANARISAGACSCVCNPSGAWSCSGATIEVENGGGCGAMFTVDAGACTTDGTPTSHLELTTAPLATGTVMCAPDASAAGATTDALSLCAASCDAGALAICAQPAGQRCIAADGIQPCPSSTLTQHIVGSGATAACSACTCQPSATPACTATAHVYYGYFMGPYQPNNNCSSGGSWTSQTATLNNTCQGMMYNYDSFDVEWNAPAPPTCTSAGGGGDASLTSPKTLCCN
jgi:hypothetical protein